MSPQRFIRAVGLWVLFSFFFALFSHFFAPLVLIAAFTVEVIWLVKLKSITVEYPLWISYRR